MECSTYIHSLNCVRDCVVSMINIFLPFLFISIPYSSTAYGSAIGSVGGGLFREIYLA